MWWPVGDKVDPLSPPRLGGVHRSHVSVVARLWLANRQMVRATYFSAARFRTTSTHTAATITTPITTVCQ